MSRKQSTISNYPRPTLALLAGAAVLFACERAPIDLDKDPTQTQLQRLDSQAVRSTAKANVRTHLLGFVEAAELAFEHELFGSLGFGNEATPCVRVPDPAPDPSGNQGGEGGGEVGPGQEPGSESEPDPEPGCGASDPTNPEELEEMAEEIVDTLLSQAAIEQETETQIVYRVRSQDLCESGSPCADLLAAVPIRLSVTSRNQGDLDVALFVGPDRFVPLTLELGADTAALRADLAHARAAAVMIADALGEDIPEIPVAQGVVKLSLTRNAPSDFTFELDVERAVSVQMDDYFLRVAAAQPAAALHIDGTAGVITGAASFGAIEAELPTELFQLFGSDSVIVCSGGSTSGPSNPVAPRPEGEEVGEEEVPVPSCGEVEPEPSISARIGVLLGGLTGQVVLTDTENALFISGFGLGSQTSRVRWNGEEILALDLNAQEGRKVDVTVHASGDNVDIQYAPSLDLRAELHLGPIAIDLGEELPSWAFSEVLGLRFDGAQNPTIRLLSHSADAPTVPVDPEPNGGTSREEGEPVPPPVPEPEPEPAQVAQVLAGVLTLSSSSEPSLVIEAGQCIYAANDFAEESHPLAGLSAGICR